MTAKTAGHKPDRVETGLLLTATLTFFGFVLTVPLDLPTDLEVVVNSLGFSLIFLLAAAHLAYRAARGDGDERAWAWLAGALLLFAISNLWYSLAGTLELPFGQLHVADGLWLLAFVPMAVGFAAVVRPLTRNEGSVAVLDASLVASGVFTLALVALSMALDDILAIGGRDVLLFNTLDVLGDDILLAIALGAAHATHWRPPMWVWTLLGGALSFALADAFYVLQVAGDQYVEGGALDIGWPFSALLVSLAAYQRYGVQRAVAPPRRWDSSVQTLLSAFMIPVAATGLLLQSDGPIALGARVAGLIAISLAGLRLFVAVQQATTMAGQLRESRMDTLTGLPNLRALRARPQRLLSGCILVTVDLDGLREINADFSERAGDQVLIAVADRIAQGTRDRDLLARIGGDEFGILLHDTSAESAARIAETIVAQIENEIPVDGHAFRVSACAGISSMAETSADVDQLVGEAQSALREAKREGSGLVRSFAGITGAQSQERLQLRAEIKESLRGDAQDFVPYFQPIVSLADNRLLCVEALVRWHRAGQVWAPGEFIDEVARSANMARLTAHMLEASLRDLRAAGIDLPVTVNVPPDLVDGMLLHVIRGALAETGSTPSQLIVEITEDAIMRNPAQAASVLGELRAMGIRVLLDDFGTGWSGLSALRDFVVDGLKLDGSFTRAMHDDPTTSTIVQSVSDLASQLGMLVIYEGVEDPQQLDRLVAQGDGYVQGFAVAHPMPARLLARWVAVSSVNFAEAAVDLHDSIWE